MTIKKQLVLSGARIGASNFSSGQPRGTLFAAAVSPSHQVRVDDYPASQGDITAC